MKDWLIKNMCMLSTFWILSLIGIFVLTAITIPEGAKASPLQAKIMFFCLAGLILEMFMGFFHRWLPRWYACDAMDWHTPNVSGICSRCGKVIDYL